MWIKNLLWQKHYLQNGLEVWILPVEGAPIERFSCVVFGGARFDETHALGSAHLLEHVLPENLPNFETAEAFEQIVEEEGGSLMLGGTTFEGVHWAWSAPADSTDLLIGVTDEMGAMIFKNPLKSGLRKEKSIVLSELAEDDSVMHPAVRRKRRKVRELLLAGNLLQGLDDPGGSIESVKHINWYDLRLHYHRLFHPKNAVLTAVGGMDPVSVQKLLEKTNFGKVTTRLKRTDPIKSFYPDAPKKRRLTYRQSELGFIESSQVSYEAWTALPGEFNPLWVDIAGDTLWHHLHETIREATGLSYGFNIHMDSLGGTLLFQTSGLVGEALSTKVERLVAKAFNQIFGDKDLFESARKRYFMEMKYSETTLDEITNQALSELLEFRTVGSHSQKLQDVEGFTYAHFREMGKYFRSDRRLGVLVLP